MMSQHFTSVFEQIGNFTKNNLGHNSAKHGKNSKDGKTANHVEVSAPTNSTNTVQTLACNKHHVAPQKKPLKLRNVASKAESYDSLYVNGIMPTPCTERACLGSVMALPGRGTEPRPPSEVLSDAKDFLDQYFASIRRANTSAHEARWQTVRSEVEATGTYQLTETELAFGAKLAWRNAARCIGRIQWSKLQVFDCRPVTTTSGMFEALCNHIKYSTNKGAIRSALTVFPQRTDGKHDYRIWNSQLISYAGYKNPDGSFLGDPMHVEFTELCIKLGWKPPRTAWDILPLVLSANGKDPDYFDIPRELVLEVHLSHPTFKWFEELNLRWYALPAVSGMRFDCGGIEFTANAFNGWYMSTEIGCRNLCDTKRLNMLEPIATRMGLDTRFPASLWKDRALVEANAAVLHSFKQQEVILIDHHTAADNFLKHLENENRLRSGCPADWIWIVPPMSSSVTPVFHQEMALYYLRPSYEYQEPPWKTHQWTKGKPGSERGTARNKPKRKFNFKQIARAVKFTSKLFGHALSKRIKATVLYATETGRSEQYAKKLGVIFGHAFNAQVYCMADYDITSIEHEALLLVVTSTFGNGDPPENGEAFANNLYEVIISNASFGDESLSVPMQTPKSFIKANSQADLDQGATSGTGGAKKLSRLESLKGVGSEVEDTFGPLSNVRFAVFALGSSAYPNFCAFGQFVDKLLGELGGERLLELATGDELVGQDQAFRKWAASVFNVSCETFCLDDLETLSGAAAELGGTLALTEETVRFTPAAAPAPLEARLQATNHRPIVIAKALNIVELGVATERNTIFVEFDVDLDYQPGDHVGILACNRTEMVMVILARLQDDENKDQMLELHTQKETHTSNGVLKTWERHERLPPCSLRELFTRFLDITSPPAANVLQYLATTCTDDAQRNRLNHLATDSSAYEEWRHYEQPNLPEVLTEFSACRPRAKMLAALLPPLQPRFYSISSSPLAHKGKLHLTVAVVAYRTRNGTGPTHYGVCSNYLKDTKPGDTVYMFVRSAASFHLPADLSKPIILIGPGTGIAPFRGFWHHRHHQMKTIQVPHFGDIWLFFGCRTMHMDLYRDEKDYTLQEGVLTKTFLALSREKDVPKMYVQGLVEREGAEIYKKLSVEGAHFFVCGDVTMAEDVYQTLKAIVKKHGGLKDDEVDNFLLSLRDENRYHEDIFGITLRTAEVHSKSRESAKNKQARARRECRVTAPLPSHIPNDVPLSPSEPLDAPLTVKPLPTSEPLLPSVPFPSSVPFPPSSPIDAPVIMDVKFTNINS